jgi:hypothetical protein
MAVIQPSLRDFGNFKLFPALKRRAIVTTSLRDRQPPFTPIIHHKINTGKEFPSVASDFRLRAPKHEK